MITRRDRLAEAAQGQFAPIARLWTATCEQHAFGMTAQGGLAVTA
jgi:hypothetical protein